MKLVLLFVLLSNLLGEFDIEFCSLAGMCELFAQHDSGELWFETPDESVLDHFAMNGWRGTDDQWYPVLGEFTCIDGITEPPVLMRGKMVLYWHTSSYVCFQEFDRVYFVYMPVIE